MKLQFVLFTALLLITGYNVRDLAWTILGHVYQDRADEINAEAAYTQALVINPRRVEALTGLGILARKKSNYDKAMDYYQKSVAIDPNYAQAYSSMVVIALAQRKDSQALEYATKAHNLDKADPMIAANLAVAYHYNGMLDLRDQMAEKARTLGYKSTDKLQKIFSGELTIRECVQLNFLEQHDAPSEPKRANPGHRNHRSHSVGFYSQ